MTAVLSQRWNLKTRLIAGVEVPDTPLINSIHEFCKDYYNDEMSWNHINRSWLFGVIMASKTSIFNSPTSFQNASFDPEIHAIAALLHDVSWDCSKPGGNFCSPDKRFEVDGANSAISILLKNAEAGFFDSRKLQLVWDSIALHTTPSIALHKESEVAITCSGISADFTGPIPGGLVTWEEWDRIVEAFPRVHVKEDGGEEDFKEWVRKLICGHCIRKPESTHGTWMEGFGEKWVEGYEDGLKGRRMVDLITIPIVKPDKES